MRCTLPALLLAALLISVILVTGCTGNYGPAFGTPAPATPPVPQNGTAVSLREIVPYVDSAALFARDAGKEKALYEFNDPDSAFNRGGAYICSEGFDGMALAEPFEQEIVGTNILDMTDPYGIPIVRNLIDTAREGKGLVSYHYRNPLHNNTIESKVSYVVNIDGTYYIAAGYYENVGTVFPAAGRAPEQQDLTSDDLVAFVREARDYARKYGREQALSAFNNKSGPFARQELYIIAYDSREQNLAHPNSPMIRNLSLKHYTDQDSVATIAGLADIARRGGGFAHTTQQIPVEGRLIFAPKLQYVLPVDDTWWVSAAILNPDYTQLRTGNLTGVRIRNQTQEDLYLLVNRAVRYAHENGKEQALAEIGKPGGQFAKGDLFVWAEGFDGTVLADPYLKDVVGMNCMDYTDSYGEKTTMAGISAIRNGTGYVHGMFPDTATGSVKPVPKLMYLKAVDDTWWIGGGIYGVEVR
jgi:signal transduction histidine kinase